MTKITVEKRDGRIVDFQQDKIIKAILAAYNEVYKGDIPKYAEKKAQNIANYIENKLSKEDKIYNIEEISDLVEKGLMEQKDKEVAKAYILYREKRNITREKKSAFMQEAIEKLSASNVQNQNANVDEHSFGGRKGEADRVLNKKIALDYYVSKKTRENHLNNEVYIHDLDSYAVGMHNCAARETQFCTAYNGVRSFKDYHDGDVVEVITPYGNIESATVHSYGKQRLNKITFSFAGQRFVTQRFTSNHRWLLQDGTETSSLKVGDKLLKAPISMRIFNWNKASEKERYYWCLGFILADGTEAYRWSHGKKNPDIKFVRMRLCGNKIQYESRFAQLKHSTKELKNGDLYLIFSSTIGLRKEFPDISCMTRQEKLALFDGLYSADGQHTGSRKSILTTNEQIASFIEDEAPSLGYFILNIKNKTGEQTNYKTRGFTKEYTFIGDNNKYYWSVINIEPDDEEEVWCLDVAQDHSFILPNGITTGNCLTIPFDKLLAEGFNTRQMDIRPAGSVSSAFQLVAVIFQLQSLQQFGGCSASHIDWSMVPYVRKSFNKHYIEGIRYILGHTTEGWDTYRNEPIDSPHYKQYNQKVYQYALDMTEKETRQAIEGMYHNLNTLQSRSGNQLPFTSINYGTCTLPEGRMITKALLEESIKGGGKLHKTYIFPCGIFQCMKGVNRKPGDPNYDLFKLALRSTAQRLYPNYVNVDWSVNKGYDRNDPRTYVSTMGKRKLQLI